MNDDPLNLNMEEIHEECGVFGVYGVDNAASLAYYGLHALQHRGQEACGIVCVNDEGRFSRVKGEGLVTEVFNTKNVATLSGRSSVAHVRYSTAGGGGLENVQPFLFHHHSGNFALCHNGNLVNSNELKKYLEDRGSIFQSTSDSELLAHLIKSSRMRGDNFHYDPDRPLLGTIKAGLNMIEGAFAFLLLTPDALYCMRDKYGLRPLSIGTLNGGYVVSSETCALDTIGARYLRDVEPGEVIVINQKGLHSSFYSSFNHHYMCAMEYIYFSRPDSDIEDINVHAYRKNSGRILYRESPVDADIVVGVPDSSLSAAMGYSEESGIPYEMGLIKNKYVGRTFIQPTQELREQGVRMKLSAVRTIVKGKRVVMIDDSIVRGTTSRRIVKLLRDAGAVEVHVRIASPPYCHPCYYGVDTATYEELISSQLTVDELCKKIGADSLYFLSHEGLYKSGNRKELCTACFSGNYPTALYDNIKKEIKHNC